MQQLKLWQQREKEWARSRAKREKSNKRNIYFNDSVMLLEAAARNDIEEGNYEGINIAILIHNNSVLGVVLCFIKCQIL
jgi:hypothetical protein